MILKYAYAFAVDVAQILLASLVIFLTVVACGAPETPHVGLDISKAITLESPASGDDERCAINAPGGLSNKLIALGKES